MDNWTYETATKKMKEALRSQDGSMYLRALEVLGEFPDDNFLYEQGLANRIYNEEISSGFAIDNARKRSEMSLDLLNDLAEDWMSLMNEGFEPEVNTGDFRRIARSYGVKEIDVGKRKIKLNTKTNGRDMGVACRALIKRHYE